MAMNKKEQALIEELLTVSALRYTADVEKDVPVPEPCSNKTSRGFIFYGEGSDSSRIEEIESTSISHCTAGTKFSGSHSHGGRSLYSTRLLALRALRRAVEKVSAKRLRDVDIMIEREENK
jgi:hypothetical protein